MICFIEVFCFVDFMDGWFQFYVYFIFVIIEECYGYFFG